MNNGEQAAEERAAWRFNGFAGVLLAVAVLGAAGFLALLGSAGGNGWLVALAVIAAAPAAGFRAVILKPNEAGVVTFFGHYAGSIKAPGFHMYLPFGRLHRTTLRLLNFDVGPMKVNDADGNPIMIGAVAVIRAKDTFKAVFNVEDWTGFAETQAETAVRSLAANYPYDAGTEETPSLLRHVDSVRGTLIEDMHERLEPAGLEVVDARLSHLAYAREIASAMLQRQQADATVAARRQIAEGAAAIVEDTLERLRTEGTVRLDDRDISRVAANLMVVLTSGQPISPVIDVSG